MIDKLYLYGNSERDASANAQVDGISIVDEMEFIVEDLNQELEGGFGINGLYPPVKGLSDVQNHGYEVYDPLFTFLEKVRALKKKD